jgi:hypothetical protein
MQCTNPGDGKVATPCRRRNWRNIFVRQCFCFDGIETERQMQRSLVRGAAAAISLSARAQTPTITRLDGTRILPSEKDATMTRLPKAAEVTGAAMAVIDSAIPSASRRMSNRGGS